MHNLNQLDSSKKYFGSLSIRTIFRPFVKRTQKAVCLKRKIISIYADDHDKEVRNGTTQMAAFKILNIK